MRNLNFEKEEISIEDYHVSLNPRDKAGLASDPRPELNNWPNGLAWASQKSLKPQEVVPDCKKTTSHMEFLLWNSRSVNHRNHFSPKQQLIRFSDCHIVVLNEEWVSGKYNNYCYYTTTDLNTESDKINTSILVRKDINHKRIDDFDITNTIAVRVGNLVVIGIYLRPSDIQQNQLICADISERIHALQIKTPHLKVIIFGDLNGQDWLIETYCYQLSKKHQHTAIA